jgi:hypothetical protein
MRTEFFLPHGAQLAVVGPLVVTLTDTVNAGATIAPPFSGYSPLQVPGATPYPWPNQVPNMVPQATPQATPYHVPTQMTPYPVPYPVPNAVPGATPQATPYLVPPMPEQATPYPWPTPYPVPPLMPPIVAGTDAPAYVGVPAKAKQEAVKEYLRNFNEFAGKVTTHYSEVAAKLDKQVAEEEAARAKK